MHNILSNLLGISNLEAKSFVNRLTFSQMYIVNESINNMQFDKISMLYEETSTSFNSGPQKPMTSSAIKGNTPSSNSNIGQLNKSNTSDTSAKDLDDILDKIKKSRSIDYKNKQFTVKTDNGNEEVYTKDQIDQISKDPQKAREIEKKKPGLLSQMADKAIDNYNPISSFVKGYNSAKLESVDTELNEELNMIRRLAGVNGKNENCAGTKADTPSIIGNTSDSHKPTSKLRHELRKKLVAKERMKDNKYKKPS